MVGTAVGHNSQDWESVAVDDMISNGNASETKANESFDNSVFFDIDAKLARKQIIFETKRTH